MADMISVRIVGIALDSQSQPVVILKPVGEAAGEGSMLPIWIGPLEAAAILRGLDDDPPPRPLTLDLMRHLIHALGAEVERIEIPRIEQGTFYAEITLSAGTGPLVLDARPSDAIGLAIRTGSAILVPTAVFEAAGIPDEREHGTDEESQEAQVEAFGRFLDNVEPEDFQG